MKLFIGLFFILFISICTLSWGQNIGDFRSLSSSATWNTNTVWERWNGSIWDTCGVGRYPGAAGNNTQNVSILNGHSMTWNAASISCGPVTVDAGGTLIHAASAGTYASLTVAGTLNLGTIALSNKGMQILNDLMVTSTGIIQPIAGQGTSGNKHTLTIGGNVINNGNIIANATYSVTGKTTKTAFNFKKAGTATISTTGTPVLTAFGNLGVNSATTLDIQIPITIGGTTVGVVADSGQIISSNGNTVTYLTMNSPALTYSGSVQQTTGPEAHTAPSININNSNGVKLGSNVVLGGSLSFTTGKLLLGAYNITVSGSVTGASSSNYVVTDGNGSLKMNVANTGLDVLIPVGYTGSYTPIALNNSLTGISDYFSVKVKNTFDITPNTSKLVKKLWSITESGTGADVKVILQWNPGDEDPSFVRTNPLYLRKNIGSSWISTSASYADSGTGIYTASASGFKEFGNFMITTDPPQTLTLQALIEGLFDGSSLVSDTVTVELHNAASPYALVESERTVLNTAGTGTVIFCNEVNGTPYYLTVKHRNAVETWSASGQSFIASALNYDFTSSQSQAYGSNLVHKGSKWCIYSGDVNQDGLVELADLIAVDNDNANYVSGYTNTDLNGDGIVELSDLIIVDNNNANYAGKVIPSGILSRNKDLRAVEIKRENK